MKAREIDIHVGQRMRQRREALGVSQGRLGRHFGLAFSQIQKYEKGSNRIGAGRLYQIANFLGVTPNWFFEDIESADPSAPKPPPESRASAEEVKQLTDAFKQVADPSTRASVIELARSLTKQER